jgi:hypothetical protein
MGRPATRAELTCGALGAVDAHLELARACPQPQLLPLGPKDGIRGRGHSGRGDVSRVAIWWSGPRRRRLTGRWRASGTWLYLPDGEPANPAMFVTADSELEGGRYVPAGPDLTTFRILEVEPNLDEPTPERFWHAVWTVEESRA